MNRLVISVPFLFLFIGFTIYSNSLDVPFYLDDLRNISENTHVHINKISFSALHQAAFKSPLHTRPVANTSFALNYYFGGLNVFGYHLVNIAIHVLTSFFLYVLFSATLTTPALSGKYSQTHAMALFGALLFLVHPLHTGSVTYIVQRMVSMAAMFYIMSLVCYIQGRKIWTGSRGSGWIWFACSFIFFLLALGSKEIAASLPFVIFLYEWYFFQNLDRKWFKGHVWYILLIFVAGTLLFFAMGGIQEVIIEGYKNRPFSPGERLLTQFRVVLFYVSLLLFPYPGRLNLDHYFPISHSLLDPITTCVAFAVLVILLCVSVLGAKKHRLFSFAILWYLGTQFMESSVIGLELVFEHRTYLPSVFLLFSLVVFLFQCIRSRWIVYCSLVVAAGIWSYWTVERNELWRDPVMFWSDSAQKAPQKARPLMNLSVSLRERGDFDAAIAASERAIAINPRFVNGFVGLAAAHDAKGELEKAASLYEKAIKMLPEYAEVYNALGVVYMKQRRTNDALDAFDESLRLRPNNVNTLVNRANVMAHLGNFKGAVRDFDLAIRLGGNNPDIHFNLALAYLQSGQPDKSIPVLEEVLRLNPGDSEARKTLEKLRTRR